MIALFTGIIEEVGTVLKINKGENSCSLCIEVKKILNDVKLGDSIAVNGVCLTVTDFNRDYFWVQAMPETMKRTNLSHLSLGNKVNLERALALGDRLGGHLVSGHVDGIGRIKNLRKDEIGNWIFIECSKDMLNQMVFKGSITIDGISLTIAKLYDEGFEVCIIPHTTKETTLLYSSKEKVVNLECDIIGKYIQKFMCLNVNEEGSRQKSKLDMNFLLEKGFM